MKKTAVFMMAALIVFGMNAPAWSTGQSAGTPPAETGKWMFLSYWELNENMPTMQHVQIAKQLTEAGLFPPAGVEIIRFDKTPGGWGIILFTAESPEDAFSVVQLWKIAGAGFFKKIKVSPALSIRESAGNAARLYQSLKEAEEKVKSK